MSGRLRLCHAWVRQARVAAEEGDELVAGAGWAGQLTRVGEQTRPGFWGDE